MKQAHVHVERDNSVLLAVGAVAHPDRVADVLDADAIDGQAAGIGTALNVLDLGRLRPRNLSCNRWSHSLKPTSCRLLRKLGALVDAPNPHFEVSTGAGHQGRWPGSATSVQEGASAASG